MNTPNTITIIRVLMTPLLLFLMLSDAMYQAYWSLAVFVLAAATDGIDGHIARKHQLITTFGTFADPLADKLLVSAALVGLTFLGRLNPWFAFVIISREFIVTGLRLVAVAEGKVLAAGTSGKIKTVLQMVAIAWMLLDPIFPIAVGGVAVSALLMIAAVLMTVYSGAEYLWINRNMLSMK